MLGTLIQKSSQTLFDLLFPPNCVHCKAADSWLCSTCLANISFITTSVCERCGTPASNDTAPSCVQCRNHSLQYIDGIRAAAYFEDNPIRSAIHSLKYRNHRALALALSEILGDTYQRYDFYVDVIVPVPLHRSRVKERGYNQSELLANQLGSLLGLPVNSVTLQRTRKTKAQMTLGVEERYKNVAGAFVCCDQQLVKQKIILIDDVTTTGSTLDACAAALKRGGVTSVWGLTLAKAR